MPVRYLIHDRDTKFTDAFDTICEAEGVEIVDIPYQAPNANAFAERWVLTAREECLHRVIILNQAHLRRVMREYVAFFNTARPIRALLSRSPFLNRGSAIVARCGVVT